MTNIIEKLGDIFYRLLAKFAVKMYSIFSGKKISCEVYYYDSLEEAQAHTKEVLK